MVLPNYNDGKGRLNVVFVAHAEIVELSQESFNTRERKDAWRRFWIT
jgi:hypothetical protein